MSNYYNEYFDIVDDRSRSVCYEDLDSIVPEIIKVKNSNKKVIVVGNGGSAAIASHVAVDFTKAAAVRAITFNESALQTCFSNDYGYEHWVEKSLEFYAEEGDLLILISSSGESSNIINAAKYAKSIGMFIVTLTGFSSKNSLRRFGDINLWVDSCKYNIVEIVHQTWILSVVDNLVENQKLRNL